MKLFYRICCKLRALIEPFNKSAEYYKGEINPEVVSDIIYDSLMSSAPCMIARFGGTELWCLANYLSVKKGGSFSRLVSFLRGEIEPWWWMPQRLQNMKNCSGFFPITEEYIGQFCELLLEDLKCLDILASWLDKESVVSERIQGKTKVFLPYLEPYYSSKPWTRALKDQKVLVIHPFNNQIEKQYNTNRAFLFSNEDILPTFKLITIKAVQSLGGDIDEFATWFDALEYMKTEMDRVDYDVCIIGCGAYGFHLAAHAKRMGKKAIHLGGATQLLFGIKGNRWEDPMYGVKEWGLPYGFYTKMFNEYWIKPGEEGRPKNAEQVEGACYW